MKVKELKQNEFILLVNYLFYWYCVGIDSGLSIYLNLCLVNKIIDCLQTNIPYTHMTFVEKFSTAPEINETFRDLNVKDLSKHILYTFIRERTKLHRN